MIRLFKYFFFLDAKTEKIHSSPCMSLKKRSAWVLLPVTLKTDSTNHDVVAFTGRKN